MKHIRPPKIPTRFLKWFCPQDLHECILGDLTEQYEEDNELFGYQKSRIRFTWNVIRFCRPEILLRNNKSNTHFNQIAMFKNYFKIGYRNLLRYKFFSLINILGLSIGTAMSLFIITHIFNELSYESSYKNYEKIYRITSDRWAKLPPSLSIKLKEESPEIKKIGRIHFLNQRVMEYGSNQILIEKPYLVDESILDIFSLEFIEGNSKGALDARNEIVLTERVANRLFKPGARRIGEEITFLGNQKYYVTGIIKDLPQNTHLKMDCLVSMADTGVSRNTSQSWSAVGIYALIDSKKEAQKVADRLFDFQIRFNEGNATKEDILAENDFYGLHPISEIHLNSHREKEIEANSDVNLLYIFGTLVVFILIVVIINFVNLYVSQTLNRLKEIGIRKVMGALRKQLIFQFLSEAFLLVAISGVIAIGLVYISIPFYNQLVDVQLSLADLLAPRQLILFFSLLLLIGLMAGGFPSIYLSKFSIDQGLKTKNIKGDNKYSVRTIMVACQFLISTCLLTATVIVSRQMDYVQNKNLGFAQEEVVAIKLHGNLWWQTVNHTEKVRNELLKNSAVKQLSITSKAIGDRFGVGPFSLSDKPKDVLFARNLKADTWFLETMGIEIINGSSVGKSLEGNQYILNERASSLLQRDDNDIIGKKATNDEGKVGTLVGIVKDFHFASLHNDIDPLVITTQEDLRYADYLLIRIVTNEYRSTLKFIESTLQEIAPGSLMISYFLNDKMENLYHSEDNLFTLFKVFSTIVILLACLGLFALFAFVAQTRKKELGIRKTLGATVWQLLLTLGKTYFGILILAIVLAIPITWYFSSNWLTNFAFQTTVYWWYFLVPGLFILVLATLAIILQSWKVANVNPIESLRDE